MKSYPRLRLARVTSRLSAENLSRIAQSHSSADRELLPKKLIRRKVKGFLGVCWTAIAGLISTLVLAATFLGHTAGEGAVELRSTGQPRAAVPI